MKHQLRSAVCTEGRRMAGARALWVATGMKREQFGKPIIAVVNSFTQFVPGHTHLHEIGQIVKQEIEAMGCYAAEFNTIAIDDGIAMGHDGMLYSLPSRDIIADSVEYMCNGRRHDLHLKLRQGDSGYAHGFHETQYPYSVLLGRTNGGWTLARRKRRPHHCHDKRCRSFCQR